MAKAWTYPIGLVALALAAVPSAAQAAPAPAITSDTTLKFGEKGVLNMDGWDPKSEKFKARKSPVAVRVLKIDKGKAADVKKLRLPAAASGMVPYYIRAELSYAGADFTGSGPLFDGAFSDGSSSTALITSEDVGPCANTDTVTLDKKHKTVLQCTAVLAPAKVPVVSAYLFYSVSEHKSVKVSWTKSGE